MTTFLFWLGIYAIVAIAAGGLCWCFCEAASHADRDLDRADSEGPDGVWKGQ